MQSSSADQIKYAHFGSAEKERKWTKSGVRWQRTRQSGKCMRDVREVKWRMVRANSERAHMYAAVESQRPKPSCNYIHSDCV